MHTSHWQSLKDAYDLTVDDLHTYYVSTGTTYLLVHNTDGACPKWVADNEPLRDRWRLYVLTPATGWGWC
ncbi:hypothetical protein MTQ10_31040 [Streptomyces sp. XM83C]|uniref:hypothetical protein n=1 Tax=Streptomyces sp. XM83C TaxID=2929781 RepID=UPI001FF98CAE|nr:hypothetical protein [Streptomyces sp. XM83C]MCK1823884.1 hypothetical protein [Streptomyces sp. XM83C]